jgi:hypothetical protein
MAEMLTLGAVLLLAIVFAEYAGMRRGLDKQMGWIAAGGWLFILTEALTVGLSGVAGLASVIAPLTLLFSALGVLFVLVGVLWSASRMLQT